VHLLRCLERPNPRGAFRGARGIHEEIATGQAGRWTERALLALIAGAAWGLAAPECAAAKSDRCRAEPAGEVRVYLEGVSDTPSARFTGEIVAIAPADDLGFMHLEVREASGQSRRIALHLPGGATALKAGLRAAFRIDVVPGVPGASALVIRDDQGLVLAAASDQAPGAAVLRDGLEGFSLSLDPTTCPSRPHDACLVSVANRRLRARHSGGVVALYHGESAWLGRWRVRCLTAQAVKYARGCADVALFGVSYVIARER